MILMQLSSFDGEGMAFLTTCDARGAYRYQWRGEWPSCPGAIATTRFSARRRHVEKDHDKQAQTEFHPYILQVERDGCLAQLHFKLVHYLRFGVQRRNPC